MPQTDVHHLPAAALLVIDMQQGIRDLARPRNDPQVDSVFAPGPPELTVELATGELARLLAGLNAPPLRYRST